MMNENDDTDAFPNAPRNSVCNYLTVVSRRERSNTVSSLLRVAKQRFNDQPPAKFASALSEKLSTTWIEQVFKRRECSHFVADRVAADRCGCGRPRSGHSLSALARASIVSDKWCISRHTIEAITDAFGTIEFQGGAHVHKARYVRLGYDSDPADIVYLLEKVWQLEAPKVQQKLGRVFRAGLLKAAQTTGAWIITSGVDSGIVRHVAQALDDAGISARMRSKIITIGVAPWGLLKKRERFVGKDALVAYDTHSFSSRNRFAVLNDRHSYFLLVDNGTVGRNGADIVLRRRFELFLAQKQTLGCGTRRVPVVAAVLEGGTNTIRAVLEHVSSDTPIPVVVCDGSGRAADLLAFAHQFVQHDGSLPVEIREQLLSLIGRVFADSDTSAENLLVELLQCVCQKHLAKTINRTSTTPSSRHFSSDRIFLVLIGYFLVQERELQLALTLAWNRVDIARSDVFFDGEEWSLQALHAAMFDALLLDRVDFVKLLLENGVSMRKFLTIQRLEQLYNSDQGSQNTLFYLIRDLITHKESQRRYSLFEIGLVIEKLMGNAYRSQYTSRSFRHKYDRYKEKSNRMGNSNASDRSRPQRRRSLLRDPNCADAGEFEFAFPFNELMLWAVLTKRQAMAKCMWHHGEEAMAKSLVAVRLYRAMAREAANDYLEVEICNELRTFAEQFRNLSLELLEHCYEQSDTQTLQLLTVQLQNWSQHTCLSLAVIANNKTYLAHSSCQILLAELWHGGLRLRSQANMKVIMAILFPPIIILLDFKKREKHHKSTRQQQQQRQSKQSFENESDNELFNETTDEDAELGRMDLQNQSVSSDLSLHLVNLLVSKQKKLEDKQQKDRLKSSRRYNSLGGASNGAGNSTNNAEERIAWRKKFFEFYRAPIATFWAWALSFCVFMLALTYTILVKTPDWPSWLEWYLLCNVIAMALEHLRKMLAVESDSYTEKMRIFFGRFWNNVTALAIFTFLIGFTLRLQPGTPLKGYGRVILATNSVLWNIKSLHLMSVHHKLGPYIMMAAKMVLNMSYIVVMLMVTLLAFGLARQSITYPNEKWSWVLVRNIFYKPYFMLYGEVYAGEIDTCIDEGTNCVPGIWITPILMTIFMLVANVLLINMLIAIFNNIFNETNAISQQVWLFQRYEQVMEYDNTPILPPPLTPICHLFLLIRLLSKKCRRRRMINRNNDQNSTTRIFDFAMKLVLNEEEMRRLHDFEEDSVDAMTRRKLLMASLGTDNLIQKTAERAEFLSLKLNDLLGKEHTVRGGIRDLELRLEAIEQGQKEIIQLLHENMSLSPRSARLGRWSTNNEDQNQSQTMIEGQQQRSDSLHSLPELATNRNRWRPARPQREYTTITDQIAIARPVQQRSTVLDKDRSRPSQPLVLNIALPYRNRNESVSVSTTEDLAEMLHDLEVVSPNSSLSMCSRSPVPRSEF